MTQEPKYCDVVDKLNEMLPDKWYLSFNYTTNGYQHVILFLEHILYDSENTTLYYYDSKAETDKEYSILEYCILAFKSYQDDIKSIKLKKT